MAADLTDVTKTFMNQTVDIPNFNGELEPRARKDFIAALIDNLKDSAPDNTLYSVTQYMEKRDGSVNVMFKEEPTKIRGTRWLHPLATLDGKWNHIKNVLAGSDQADKDLTYNSLKSMKEALASIASTMAQMLTPEDPAKITEDQRFQIEMTMGQLNAFNEKFNVNALATAFGQSTIGPSKAGAKKTGS